MKILLYANGSGQNHGCEAIRKTTMELFGENQYYVGTTNIKYDEKNNGETSDLEFIQYDFKKTYTIFQRLGCRLRIIKSPKGKLHLQQFLPYFQKCDLAISVGGDNYCYGDSEWLYTLNAMARTSQKNNILWGASIEENLIDERMRQDLSDFSLIVVRESISLKSLLNNGIKNVIISPDPAFTLNPRKPAEFSKGFNEKQRYIGFNISPLLVRKEKIRGIIFQNVKNVIDHILRYTDYNIMFIPHVVTSDNNDYELLKEYKNQLASDRIVLIDDMPCDCLKYYISKCDYMIAARTHASIAAYSLCIPTVVLGYSVKSRGIAYDLFGSSERYVIPVDSIIDDTKMLEAYKWLQLEGNNIRKKLREMMPKYLNDVKTAVGEILQLQGNSINE